MSSAWLGLPLPSQALLMGARNLVDATTAGAGSGIPVVVVETDDTPSQPNTEDTNLDDPEDYDPLSNFRCSLGEIDYEEMAATAAANAGFLHPNDGEAWRVFSSRICESSGEDLSVLPPNIPPPVWPPPDYSPDDCEQRHIDSVVRAEVHNPAGHDEAS